MRILKNNVVQEQKTTNFHLLPGRLRIGVPGLLNNQDLANFIAHRVVKFPGVQMCYANPISGQVLINFEPGTADLKLLLNWLQYASNEGLKAGDFTVCPEKPAGVGYYFPAKRLEADVPERDVPAPVLAAGKAAAWHRLDSEQVLALIESSAKTGLSYQMAQRRLAACGYNELQEGARQSFWQIALASSNGFMTKLLLAAGGVSVLVGETADAAVIVAIVMLQAMVEAAQSCRAEKSLDNLKKLSAPVATVLREGEVGKIPGKELVPGDILHLEAGDIVPADAMLLEAVNLTTNEACLTGESIPVLKDSLQRNDCSLQHFQHLQIPVADQANMLFSGTSIIGGRATAVVVTTGMQTELGRIARLLSNIQSEQTNLQKQLDYLGKKITHLVALAVGTIAAINLLRGRPLADVLRTGISLAVGAVPEGLPAILTVALTMGVQRMVKRNAVVRNMSAVETLGSITVICTDKTGTLTKNEMAVKELYIDRTFYEVTGDGYQPEGEILRRGGREGGEPAEASPFLRETLKAAALCNNAALKPGPAGQWMVSGDPTEVALLTAAAKAGLWWQSLKGKYCRQREVAFDARRRLMTVVCQSEEGSYGVYVKGAPDAVINHCSAILGEPDVQNLDLKTRNKVLAVNEAMAQKALRVLAIAYKELPAGSAFEEDDLENKLTFCGLIGMSDTPRQGVAEAIQRCHGAGIKVVMITGDHQRTAEAVAAKLGILARGKSITGRELEHISDAEFMQQAGHIVVYSRTTPDQKLRIVRALKKHGQIVAMTGDGVNDAPAIKEADIGIAMGLSGTDVTRGAADITLSDDNFVTIVNGIEEGRAVSMNLSKSLRYILSGSLAQLFTVFVAVVLGLPTPLLPAQILWVNLVTESLPAMSLMADPPEQNYMKRPPFKQEGGFLWEQSRSIFRQGMLFGLSTFGLYAAGFRWGGWSLDKARTMTFSQLVINRVFNLINKRRTKGRKAPPLPAGGNPLILPAAAMSTLMLAVTMYLPFMRPLFSTVPLNLQDWVLLSANALAAGQIDAFLENSSREGREVQNSKILSGPGDPGLQSTPT